MPIDVDGILRYLTIIIFWVGGYLAIPMVFMATMGVFRNLAGMGQSLTGKLGTKIREPGKQERARYRGFRRANRESNRNLAAERRAMIAEAGNPLTRRGWSDRRAARRATGQQFTQRQAEEAIQDSAYTWKNDGDLNYEYVRARGDENILRQNGVSEENIQKIRMMEAKYDRASMLQAAHTQAIVGKAAAYGPGNEETVWRDAAALANGDEHALASMVGRGRTAALNAGWGTVGGAGFSGTMAFARGVDNNGHAYDHRRYLNNVIDSSGPGTLFHPSMTEEAIGVASDLLRDRAIEARSTHGEDSVQYKRALADVAGAYDVASNLPSAKGNVVADRLMGVGLLDAQGGRVGTIRQEVERHREDADFLDRRREIGRAEEDLRRRTGTPPSVGAGPNTPVSSNSNPPIT